MKGASEHFHFLSVPFVAVPWFSSSGNQKSAAAVPLGRLSEHFRDRNALGSARRRTSKLVGALHLS